MNNTDTSALSAIADATGDLTAAVIGRVKDGVQLSDAFALFGDIQSFGAVLVKNVPEAKAEIADLDFEEGVDLATLLAGQAKKIKAALVG